MSNNKQSMKLYTEEQVKKAIESARENSFGSDFQRWLTKSEESIMKDLTPIELPSDDEILKRYIFYIDTEIQLGFLEESQGARLKWYYTKYFSNKIQGGEQ